MADGRIVAIRSTTSGVTTMRYVVTDHLNSVAVILDEKAAVIAGGRQSFDAWGLQRNADGTPDSTPCNLTQSSASTRGYTGQEEMASVCLINYNARIYDPQLGRFLSADPTTEAPDDGQDWNRYSYVLNNPLAFTDPSGNSFLTDLFAAVISVAIIVLAPELIGPWATFADFMDAAASFNLSAIAVAAGSGAVAGAISAGITGGSVLKGALFGGISGALFAAVGAPLGRALSAADMLGNPVVGNFIAQGFVGGLNSTIEGGNFGSGFLAGGVGSLAGSWSGGQFDPGHMLASAIVGGAASVLGGGKFLNGAITAAFAYAATAKYTSQKDPVIFVGGAGDTESNIVSGYEAEFEKTHDIIAKYFTWDQKDEIIDYVKGLDANDPVTLIGHSYGADTAAEVALALPGRINMLITIDPVSLFSPSYAKLATVTTWIDVNAVGGSSLERSNLIAGLGGAWGSGPSGYAAGYIPVNTIHADFGTMMCSLCTSPMAIPAGC